MEHVDDRVDRVLAIAETIPPGRVLTYGDIAALVGSGGPRGVGRAMALYGATVPWWRVIRADGRPPAGHEARALAHYRAEGTPLRTLDPPRVDLGRARWTAGGPGAGRAGAPGGGVPDGVPDPPDARDIPPELAAAIPPDRPPGHHNTPPGASAR
ncbi:MGMT family protein [Streptomyces sp. ST2-7A]|nr:MGMT family protein [Streptomyces sp. ST2-7A]MCE7082497.1 MGMT family protein [Streptomyces sp. ST2-7A]